MARLELVELLDRHHVHRAEPVDLGSQARDGLFGRDGANRCRCLLSACSAPACTCSPCTAASACSSSSSSRHRRLRARGCRASLRPPARACATSARPRRASPARSRRRLSPGARDRPPRLRAQLRATGRGPHHRRGTLWPRARWLPARRRARERGGGLLGNAARRDGVSMSATARIELAERLGRGDVEARRARSAFGPSAQCGHRAATRAPARLPPAGPPRMRALPSARPARRATLAPRPRCAASGPRRAPARRAAPLRRVEAALPASCWRTAIAALAARAIRFPPFSTVRSPRWPWRRSVASSVVLALRVARSHRATARPAPRTRRWPSRSRAAPRREPSDGLRRLGDERVGPASAARQASRRRRARPRLRARSSLISPLVARMPRASRRPPPTTRWPPRTQVAVDRGALALPVARCTRRRPRRMTPAM